MSIGTRINKIRKDNKLTQVEFGNKVGLTKSAVSKAEKDVHGISDGVFLNIINEFCINEEWLRTGEGEMYNRALQNKKIITQNEVLFMSDSLTKTISKLNNIFSKYPADKQLEMVSAIEEICRLFAINMSNDGIYLTYLEALSGFLFELNRYIQYLQLNYDGNTSTLKKYISTFNNDLQHLSSFFIDKSIFSTISEQHNDLSSDEQILLETYRKLTQVNKIKISERADTLYSEQISTQKNLQSSSSVKCNENAVINETA